MSGANIDANLIQQQLFDETKNIDVEEDVLKFTHVATGTVI